MDRAVVDIAPDRRMDIVFGPDGAVREADLAPDRPLAARFAPRPNGGGRPIGVGQSETAMAPGEGRNLTARSQYGEGLVRNALNVHPPWLPSIGGADFPPRRAAEAKFDGRGEPRRNPFSAAPCRK